MGYFCKIVNEDSTAYRVNSLPIGSLQILNPSYPEEAFITITSNYKKIAESVLEGGIRGLNGKSVDDTIDGLRAAIRKLGDDFDPDYWKATEGNVKLALQGLVMLAVQCPGGIWDVSW